MVLQAIEVKASRLSNDTVLGTEYDVTLTEQGACEQMEWKQEPKNRARVPAEKNDPHISLMIRKHLFPTPQYILFFIFALLESCAFVFESRRCAAETVSRHIRTIPGHTKYVSERFRDISFRTIPGHLCPNGLEETDFQNILDHMIPNCCQTYSFE